MPDLPIVLRHQAHSLSGVGLVDSGACISVLPYSLGVQFGFDWLILARRASEGSGQPGQNPSLARRAKTLPNG